MAKKVLTNLDMQYNQLINAELGNSAGNPSTLKESMIWYDTVTHKPMYYDGTSACEFGRVYTAGNGITISESQISIDTSVVATLGDIPTSLSDLTDDSERSPIHTASTLSGLTATITELNYVDGVTSDIQTQLNGKQSTIDSSHKLLSDLVDDTNQTNKFATSSQLSQISTNQSDISTINSKIPSEASSLNQLADKAFVNSTVQTNTANFRGSWSTWSTVPTDVNDYPADRYGSKTPTVNDYLVVQDASGYTGETLTGTWRFKYTGVWSTNGKNGWLPEYQINETPLTAAQLAALNSGITAENKVTHTNSTQVGSGTKGVYIASDGSATEMTYSVSKDVPSNAVFTDTTYTFGTGSTNGSISVTPSGGSASDVTVKGLGSAAYTASTDYATSAQGAKADTAVQKYTTTNGLLTQYGGICTWTVTHNLGTRAVNVSVYETSTYEDVIVDVVRTSTSVVTIKINSATNVTAGTYTVVVHG